MAALALVCDEMEGGSRFSRERVKQKLFKTVKEQGIGILLPSMRLSYCCARLYLGYFSDWWGWEFRGFYATDETRTWAADLYWSETWLPKWGGGYVPRLLVLGEQGIGDQVFYASVIPEAMCRVGEVVYECDRRLHEMLERSLPGLRCHGERKFEDRRLHAPPDAYIPAAELLRMFRRDKAHFPGRPFLKADQRRVQALMGFSGRTGIGWSGRQGRIDPADCGIAGALSLQWNERHPDIEQPPLDLANDIDGVVALCSVLGKVVCAPSSIQHFAGAVGARVEIIKPPAGSGVTNQLPWDYSDAYRPHLPWYRDCEVFSDVAAWKGRVNALRDTAVLA